MAPNPERGHAAGRAWLRRLPGRCVERAATALRQVAFWTAVGLGSCLPVVFLFDPTLPQVSALCLLAVVALVAGRSHRPG